MGALKCVHDTFLGWFVGWTRSPSSGARRHCVGRACARMAGHGCLWPGCGPAMRSCCCRLPRPAPRRSHCRRHHLVIASTYCYPASRCRYRRHCDAVLRCRSPCPRTHVGCPGCLAPSPRLNGAAAVHAASPPASVRARGLSALSRSRCEDAASGPAGCLPPRRVKGPNG